LRSIELFAGAGGLALGSAYAGFRHEAVIEWDEDACNTITENRRRGVKFVKDWPEVVPTDVTRFDFSSFKTDLELIAGGVPCQPWSLGGKHKGHRDERNLFPDVVKIVRRLRPKAVLIENVKGLTRKVFANYFEYIKHQLRYPEITRKPRQTWMDHLRRLEQHHTSGSSEGLHYHLVARLLNAADYGIPQRRERIFIVAFRSDLGIEWTFPRESHSQDSLLWDQFVTGEYWDRHEIPKRSRPMVPGRSISRINDMKLALFAPVEKPWATVRDAIGDLPDPEVIADNGEFLNHRHNPGARSYPGHTGSPLDEPSKTLKAGVHGVPGGENTLAYGNGQLRYFTVREAARIQTFPDEYVFHASWTESMRQIGNAVPVKLAELVSRDVAEHLKKVTTGKDAAETNEVVSAVAGFSVLRDHPQPSRKLENSKEQRATRRSKRVLSTPRIS
jgi:DNA (cytosine-5)-methyltransferase 1